MNETRTNRKIESLEGIRAIAFISILLSHTAALVPGRWGVSVFLLLSGFLMTYSYWNREIPAKLDAAASFSVKKIKKLYIIHVIMIFVGLYYSLKFFDPSIKDLFWTTPITIILFQTWTPYSYQALNSVAWYLSVTLFLYFAFPFVLAFLKRHSKKTISIILLGIVAWFVQIVIGFLISHVPQLDYRWFYYCFPPYRLFDFIIGCCLGALFVKTKNITRTSFMTWTIIELMMVLAICLNICYFKSMPSKIAQDWYTWANMFLPVNVFGIYIFACGKGFISKLISQKIFGFIGKISSYAFLIHIHVMHFSQIALDKMMDEMNPIYYKFLVTLIVLLITILLSYTYMRLSALISKWRKD